MPGSPARRFAVALAVLLALAAAPANAVVPSEQLERYGQTLERLVNSALEDFPEPADALAAFALYPYLEYAALRRTIEIVPSQAVESFLARYPDLPVTPALRVAWLRELARREDWPRFLATYRGERNDHVRCARVQALRATGQSQAAIDAARELWLVGYRQPQGCIVAFDFLEQSGALTSTLIGSRIVLALQAGHARLAEVLAERLQGESRDQARRWLTLYRDPATSLDMRPRSLGPPAMADAALSAAMRSLARRDPVRAHELWPRIVTRHGVDENPDLPVQRVVALFAAYNDLPIGNDSLWALPAEQVNEVVHAWRLRSALRERDWPGVVRAVQAMPAGMARQARWRYWHAAALQRLGDAAAAGELYRRIAADFSYYGFLAADALDAPYHWGESAAPTPAEEKRELQELPGMQRALLLHSTWLVDYAQMEWRALIDDLDAPRRLAAARIAEQAEWPWAALYASGAAGVDNASALRYPRAHADALRRSAEDSGIAAPWLLAMIRQESAFQLNACSSAGACGLMQLMPGTARWVLERQRRAAEDVRETLRDADRNIALGAAYFAYLSERFGDPVLATAAYNAGPTSVARWIASDGPPAGTARWVETLLYGETRDYVQAVLFNSVVYRHQLQGDKDTERLSDLLREEERRTARAGGRQAQQR